MPHGHVERRSKIIDCGLASRRRRRYEPIFAPWRSAVRREITAEKRWQRSRLWALIRRMSAGLNHSLLRGGAGLVLAIARDDAAARRMRLEHAGHHLAEGQRRLRGREQLHVGQTSLTIPKVTTASGADLKVCWDALHEGSPLPRHRRLRQRNGIDNVGFAADSEASRRTRSPQQLAVGQFDDNLATVYGEYYTSKAPGSTCAMLSQFKLGSSRSFPRPTTSRRRRTRPSRTCCCSRPAPRRRSGRSRCCSSSRRRRRPTRRSTRSTPAPAGPPF